MSCAKCGVVRLRDMQPCINGGAHDFGVPAIAPSLAPNTDDPFQTQVGGSHYSRLAIQPMEYYHRNGICANGSMVIKYVTRWRHKNGIQDLRKARDVLDKMIDLEERFPTPGIRGE